MPPTAAAELAPNRRRRHGRCIDAEGPRKWLGLCRDRTSAGKRPAGAWLSPLTFTMRSARSTDRYVAVGACAGVVRRARTKDRVVGSGRSFERVPAITIGLPAIQCFGQAAETEVDIGWGGEVRGAGET